MPPIYPDTPAVRDAMARTYDNIAAMDAWVGERLAELDEAGILDDTNIDQREIARLRRVLKNREGIVIVTGPTGSGKTTTLYAALQEITTDEINIRIYGERVERILAERREPARG